jgi:hypothetical protein
MSNSRDIGPLPYTPSKDMEIAKLNAQIKKEEELEAKCKKDADFMCELSSRMSFST